MRAVLLLATSAHALLHSVKLGGPSPAAWFRDTFGVPSNGDAVTFGDGFQLRYDAAAAPTAGKLGCLGVGVEVPTAEALAKAGGDARRLELTGCLIPDEDAERLETLWDEAALEDPQARRVWAGFAGGGAPPGGTSWPAPAAPAAKVVLKVKDLPAALEFYTTGLGMTLLRQRSLVPNEAALVAYVGFGDDQSGMEAGASGLTRLELRYVYGSDKVEADAEINVVGDPASVAIRAGITGGAVVSQGDVCLLTDPDGYTVRVAADAALLEG